MSNDKDKLAEYYESAEANQDSRSDAWVAFITVSYTHLTLPTSG